MSSILVKPNTYSFLGNLKKLKVSADSAVALVLKHGTVEILSSVYEPVEGVVEIDLSKIVSDYMSPVLPGNDRLQILQPETFSYTVDALAEETFNVIYGGVDSSSFEQAWFAANWLTWMPQTSKVQYNQPTWLSYFAVAAGTVVKCKGYFSDNTTEIVSLGALTQCAVNVVNVRYSSLIALFTASKQPQYVDIYVEDASGNRLTYIQRLVLIGNVNHDDYFVFRNSLGGWDCVCYTGIKKPVGEFESKTSVQEDITSEYTVDATKKFTKNTGYLADKRLIIWTHEFFNSSAKYWVNESSSLVKIVVEKSTITAIPDDVCSCDFNFYTSKKTPYLNLERATAPDAPLELIDPDSNLFFLVPRLSDFTAAVLSDDILIPLQDPNVREWKQTSLGALKQFLSGISVKVDVDDALDAKSENPVQNKVITAALAAAEEVNGVGLKLNTVNNGKAFSVSLLNKAGDAVSTTDQFSGGSGSGAVKIVLTKLTANPTVKEGDAVILQYSYDHIDSSTNASTGLSGNATISITHGATVNTLTDRVSAGTTKNIDVTNYIALGLNTVNVRMVTGEGDEQLISTISWDVQVISLALTSSFNIATEIHQGDTVSIPYTLKGSGNKTIRCYVDGADTEDRSITSSLANGSFDIDTSAMLHGAHWVQIVAEVDNTTIKSQSIYLGLAVRVTGNSTPIVVMRVERADGAIFQTVTTSTGVGSTTVYGPDTPQYATAQYDKLNIIFAAYDPSASPAHVEIYQGDTLVADKEIVFTATTVTLRAMDYGTISYRIVCGSAATSFTDLVSKSTLEINEPTDGMTLRLSALGRSNSDANKTEWNYNSITSSLTGFKWGGDGWLNNALRHTDNARTTVNYKPFALPATNANSAFAFVIKYKVSDVRNSESIVAQCVDADGVGFVITAEEAKMVTKGGSKVAMKLAPGETYEIAFVSFPQSKSTSSDYEKTNSAMVYLYINGIMSGAVQRAVLGEGVASGDTIYQDTAVNISLGSSYATLDVYLLRAYNNYLTDSQVLDCFIIDQDDGEAMAEKVQSNAVLDENGNMSVDTVPDDMRYLIITGKQDNGVATVLQAAVTNNKKTKFDVDEILCVKRSNSALNFCLTGGCISLQGTSSLAYPTKNYRIYTQSASKVNGQLYLGCDDKGIGGELQAKPLYSFRPASGTRKAAAPVKCFCLKADFAESSSSHNTGMAKLANDTLVSVGELTPAQAGASADYQYDVRTTVDGEPCLLFYRATKDDTPELLGKFNFNNDKSTEAVFGFLDIPGYHDQAWVTDTFGGKNPTECWEFLNNDYKMGMFKDADFDAKDADGKPLWLNVFEARFPDDDDINAEYEAGTKKPTYLEALVKWVKSTDTTEDGITAEEIAARKSKFSTELENYFSVKYLCDYYMFTEIFGCVDQRVKNMMMGFWYDTDTAKMLAYMIFYDCDTILGVRNDGRLKYGWDIDENSTDTELTTAEKTVYAYAGHDSVLWKNLRENFASELKAAYIRLRAKLSNETIFNMFDTEQSSKFCERIYNYDALCKYVTPKTIGVSVLQDGTETVKKYSYLESMQGSRQAHRHWWVSNRMNLLDARYSTGSYTATSISWKGNSAAGATLTAKMLRKFYIELRRENTSLIHSEIAEGGEFSYSYADMANIGTIFYLLGGEWMSELDLSGWGGFTDLSLPTLQRLEKLIIGKSGSTCPLSELVIGNKLPMLKTLDMQGYTGLSTLDLSGCARLESVNAAACSALSTLTFSEGAPLTSLILPANYKILILKSLPNITRAGITFANLANISELWIENCASLSGSDLFTEILSITGNALKYVRVSGLALSGTGADLKTWMNAGMGGVDSQGEVTAHCKLIGTYQLTKYMEESELATLRSYYDELTIKQTPYQTIRFDTDVADPANITNMDNSTGYAYGNSYVSNAHVARIMSLRHRVLGKYQSGLNKMFICPLNDNDSRQYANGETAVLDGTEGDVYVFEPHYWYKGVNDFLNNKMYALYSSNTECPAAASSIKRLLTDLDMAANYALDITGTGTTADALKTSLTGYKVVKVALSGYAQVRWPFLASDTYGAVTTDSDGNVIRKINVPVASCMDSGLYVFTQIAAAEKYLQFTIDSTAEFDYVLLTHSSETEAIEPDWVEHEECLCGAHQAIALDGKLRSITNGSLATYQTTPASFDAMMTSRGAGFQRMDYDMRKDISNLFYAAYGTRDASSICGYFNWTQLVVPGCCDALGMRNTHKPADSYRQFAFTDSEGNTTNYDSGNCMGYESLWSIGANLLLAYAINTDFVTKSYKGVERHIRIPAYANLTALYSRVIGGRYLETLPLKTAVGNDGTSITTYYTDEFWGNNGGKTTKKIWLIAGDRYSGWNGYDKAGSNLGIGAMFLQEWYADDTSDWTTKSDKVFCRLCFRGTIESTDSPTAFKTLSQQ